MKTNNNSEEGKKIEWIKPFSKVKDVSYDLKDLHIKWFYDGSLNVSSNCLDRSAASTTVSFDNSSIILFKSAIEFLSLYIMFFYS